MNKNYFTNVYKMKNVNPQYIYHRIVKSVKIQTSHMIYKVHASGMVCTLYSSQINKHNKCKYIRLLTVQKWIDMIGFEMCN